MTRKTTPAASPLAAYLRDINQVALLSREEEQRLARAFREGDKRAGHRLVEANLRFVVKVALEYRWYGLPMPDLVQEGNIGLMKGVQKFDPDKQIRLISYAVWWIRAYLQNHVLKSWSLVKIGTTQTQRKLFFSLARTRREIERLSPGAGPDAPDGQDALVAKKLKVKESDVVDMQQRLDSRDFSLDAPVRDGTATHLDSTASAHALQDEELARAEEEALLARRVGDAMGRLDPRERYIVQARIMGEGSTKLRELGRHFGFSRERARQLELRALERLRRELAPDADALGWPSASRAEDRRSAARPARSDARRPDGPVPTMNGEVS